MNEKEILQNYLQQNVLATSQITEKYGISKQLLNHYVKLGTVKPILEAPMGNFYLRADIEEFMHKRNENDWDLESDFREDLLVDPVGGSTRISLQFFEENRNFLGEIESVTLYQFEKDAIIHGSYRKSYEPHLGPFVWLDAPKMVIRDTNGKEIWLRGVNCGYKGTGPGGSKIILNEMLGVPESEADKLYYHSAIHYFRDENGSWKSLSIAKNENPSDFRMYGHCDIVLNNNTLTMLASDDIKSLRGMDPDVFLKPYNQFIPDPIKATLMSREQAIETGHVLYRSLGMRARVFNLVLKDSSGRELWLEFTREGFVEPRTTHTIQEWLEKCGFELEEKDKPLSDKIKQWLGLAPITRDFRRN